jgi:hypothetical protein
MEPDEEPRIKDFLTSGQWGGNVFEKLRDLSNHLNELNEDDREFVRGVLDLPLGDFRRHHILRIMRDIPLPN